MHGGVGAATERMQQRDGIVEGGGGNDLREADIAFDQVDNLPSGRLSQTQAARIGSRDSAVAGQRDAQRFHQ